MLATLAGCLALALGVAMLLLPVLVSELSRPRDAAWGAVVLLLGLGNLEQARRREQKDRQQQLGRQRVG